MLSDANREFFDRYHQTGLYLTFDDVLLKPAHSQVLPAEADTTTRFTRNYSLKIPIISAAMDTVTEAPMAIAMAEAGGCGVIHRNRDAAWQAEQVTRVKLSRSGFVAKPKTIHVNSTVGELLTRIEERKAAGKNIFHSFVVVDDDERVVGMIGRINVDRAPSKSARIGDIMTKYGDLFKGPPGLEAEYAYKMLQPTIWSVLPLIDGETRRLKGLYSFKPLQRMFEHDSSGFNIVGNGQLLSAAAVGGFSEEECARVELLVEHGVNVIVIDASHGDSLGAIRMVAACKRIIGSAPVDVVGGNIATYDGTMRLLDAGADAIKVGVGPGSICTTREVTGFGVPQLSAIIDAVRAAEKYGVPVIGDGGFKASGDIVKALVAGADCVMLGSMLSGTDETPGEGYMHNGIRVKDYNGMGSPTSIRERAGQQRYSQIGIPIATIAPQGVDARVQIKGSVSRMLGIYVNGIRAGMGFAGAATITALQQRVVFIRHTANGLAESRIHEVMPV